MIVVVNKGYHCLVLHAHLPFVRHPEEENSLEERWLFEAITETYIPVIDILTKLTEEKLPFKITISISPTLTAMLADSLLQNRYLQYLNNLQQLATKEMNRTKQDKQLWALASMYHDRYKKTEEFYISCNRDLLKLLKKLAVSGNVELMTCCATHTYLPLFADFPETVAAQIKLAVDSHRHFFDSTTNGIWLPECGYYPGLDQLLAENGIGYFFCDTHGVLTATPQPKYGSYAPLICPSGVAAFPRDMESSKQVWSAQEGYPSDEYYREYYRDIGFDLDLDYLNPHLPIPHMPISTGIKYHRITGKTEDKQLYQPDLAKKKAMLHAQHFLEQRQQQLGFAQGLMDIPPLVVSPYDAELFGHWWFEGPLWLESYLRKVSKQQEYSLITPSEYLQLNYRLQPSEPALSSWGNKGYSEIWLDTSNEWIYPYLHQYNRQLIELLRNYKPKNTIERRALNQAIRELILAQSSDWAFIMKTNTMVPYAHKRTKNHLAWHKKLIDQLLCHSIDPDFLSSLENTNNIFPQLNYEVYKLKSS